MNGMRPVHPGEILNEEFFEPSGLSVVDLVLCLDVPEGAVNELSAQTCAVSPVIAEMLSVYFNTTPEFWLNLQSTYDLRRAEIERG